jgi:hypothetical protein
VPARGEEPQVAVAQLGSVQGAGHDRLLSGVPRG